MSLFSHLALKFGSHPENLATEALGYILGRSAAARRGFATSLSAAGSALPQDLRFTTQAQSEEQGRPDLQATDANGVVQLLVEVKFWAGFTENQPLGYLDLLSPGRVLVVVGPDIRMPYLWRELVRRVVESKRASEQVTIPGEAGHLLVDGRHLFVQSWRRLLNAIVLELGAEPAVLADVHQLHALCEKMDTEQYVPITTAELTTNIYRRVHEFGTIVDEVAAKLTAEGVISQKGLRASGANGWYGRYAFLNGVCVLIHVSTYKWTKLAPNPLWITVFGQNWRGSDPTVASKALVAYGIANPTLLHYDHGGFPTVLLRVPTGAERHEVVAAVADQIRQLAPAVAALAGTAPAKAPAPEAETLPES